MDRNGFIVMGVSNNAKIKFEIENIDYGNGYGTDTLKATTKSGDNQDFESVINIINVSEENLNEICNQISSLKSQLKWNK